LALQDQLRTNPSIAGLHSHLTRPMHKMDYAIGPVVGYATYYSQLQS
jgi:hypothetical protein